jgi:RHS repeat-associated protein
LRYVDDLVTYRNGSTDYHVLQDANWNVIGLTNVSGVVQERYTYSTFGKLNVFDASFTPKSASTFGLTRSFTGQVLDAETGLMLYRNRVYHPTLGRFMQRDPIGYSAGDGNLMRYVGNNPLYRVDFEGWQGQGWSITPGGTLALPPIQNFPVEQLYPSLVPPPPPQPTCPKLTPEECEKKKDAALKQHKILINVCLAAAGKGLGRNNPKAILGIILCSKLDDMGQAEVQLTYDRCLAKGNWNAWAADFEYLSGK